MKIQSKILLSSILVSLVVGLGIHFIIQHTIFKAFENIEKHALASNQRKVEEIIKIRQAEYNSKLLDWAVWDSAYNFIINEDSAFIDENINQEILENYEVDGVYFLNKKLDSIYGTSAAGSLQSYETIIDKFREEKIFNKTVPKKALSGVMRVNNEFYMFSLARVMKSVGEMDDYSGYIIFFRELTSPELQKISRTSQLGFVLYSNYAKKLFYSEDKIVFPYIIKDYFGHNIGMFHISMNRVHYPLYKKISSIVIVAVIGLIFILLAAMYLLLNKIVVGPLKSLEAQAHSLISNNIHENRINIHTQDEFGDLATSINTMLIEREKILLNLQQNAKLSSLGEMASGIAHEINNPLSVITLNIDKIFKHNKETLENDPNLEKSLMKISTTVKRIAKIIKGMKSLSRNSAIDEKELFSLPLLFDETVDLFKERMRNNEVKIEIDVQDYNLWMEGNTTQISQIIVNLINNAIDATEANFEKVLKVKLYTVDQKIYFEVWDNGHGIPNEIKEKILQPFFTTKQNGKGTGLGLSITNQILSLHEAKMEIESVPGNTMFRLIFPLKKKIQQAA